MSEQGSTFTSKCDILAEFWVNYKGHPDFTDFIEYSDLGLPLAYAVSTDIVEPTPKLEQFVTETFDLLVTSLGKTDTGFESLDDLIES